MRASATAALLVVALLFGACGAAALQPALSFTCSVGPTLLDLTPTNCSSLTVSLFEVLQLHVSGVNSSLYKNPFDPTQVLVQANFTHLESGRVLTIDGFIYQQFNRSFPNGGTQVLTPVGTPQWLVRFAAPTAGTYAFMVLVSMPRWFAVSSQGTVSAVNKTSTLDAGYLRVSPSSAHQFQFDYSRTPYFAVGENVAWWDSNMTGDYDHWFGRLAQVKANYARLWLGIIGFTVENAQTGIGHYSLTNLWMLDYVLGLAEQLGMRLLFCIESFNSLRDDNPYPMWSDNAYNTANGGPCQEPSQFFTDGVAINYFQRRLRYLVARYAYSTHLLAWELWNEVDLVDDYNTADVTPWHQYMANFLNVIDPNVHMVTTSFSNSLGDPRIESLPQMSYVQTHTYGSNDFAGDLAYWNTLKVQKFNKPHIVGEFGISDPNQAEQQDPTGISLHNGLWAPVVSLGAGGGAYWWWDNYIDPMNLYHHFLPVANFVADVVFDQRQWSVLNVTAVNASTVPQVPHGDYNLTLRAWGVVGDHDFALLWFQHPNNTWAIQYAGVPLTSIGRSQVQFEADLDDGAYTAVFYETYVNATEIERSSVQLKGGLGVLSVPPIDRANPDVACKLFAQQ